VRLAGRQIGEIVAIRGSGLLSPGHARRPEQPLVELEARILSSYRRWLYRNSSFFASTPNILTEAVLEVGPPANGAAPQRPVEPGESVRGVDPPDIDRFLLKVHQSVTSIMAVSRDLEPDWKRFSTELSRLMDTVDGLAPPGTFSRILVQGRRAVELQNRVNRTLTEADALPRLARIHDELAAPLGRLGPELSRIAEQIGVLGERVAGVQETFGPAQRQRLEEGVARFRRVLQVFDQIGRDLLWLAIYVETGHGTVGGFRKDIQIFDELKETHRILKRESWKLIIKRKDRGQRNVR
jgi:hypothetical protein